MPPARPPSGGGLPLRHLRPRPLSAEEEDFRARGTGRQAGPGGGAAADPAAGLDSSTTPLRAQGAGLTTIESSGPRPTFGSEGGDVTLDVRPGTAATASKKGGGGRGGSSGGDSSSSASASASTSSGGSTRPPARPVDNSAATQRRALPSLPRALRQWGRVAKLWYLSALGLACERGGGAGREGGKKKGASRPPHAAAAHAFFSKKACAAASPSPPLTLEAAASPPTARAGRRGSNTRVPH